MKAAVVTGAGGLIGAHMCAKLKREGYFVRGLSRSPWRHDWKNPCDEYWTCDLREYQGQFFANVFEVYQFACEVGGLGYIMDRANDADCLGNSTLIDMNVLAACRKQNVGKLFFASSACVYPSTLKPAAFREKDVYPANPSNEFAWQKLFAERLYQACAHNCEMKIRIGRLFNTYGPGMTWEEPRSKVVGALCRKIAQAKDGDTIEMWGDGHQLRTLTYIEDVVERIYALMRAPLATVQPLNIGPTAWIDVSKLLFTLRDISGKKLHFKKINGPVGNPDIRCDGTMANRIIGGFEWSDSEIALEKTYRWVEKQVLAKRNAA